MCSDAQIAHLEENELIICRHHDTLYAHYAGGEAYPNADYPFPDKPDDVPDYTGTINANAHAAINVAKRQR
jgi:hypothetical protein